MGTDFRKSFRAVALLASLLVFTGFGRGRDLSEPTVPSSTGGNPIDAFYVVAPGIYRGAQPDKAGYDALKALGVRTVVGLRTSGWPIFRESRLAEARGIRFISVPLGSFSTPQDRDIHLVLDYLSDPALRPIFIHCRHGEDRTGLLVGLYRVFQQNWTPADAYAEMLKYNFHPLLWALRDYYFRMTDWNPAPSELIPALQ
ncbi:MAG: hypothetical protein A2X94_07235 [Bdellovibrionales bacterium GWB1_55_8]|nr:MAG: hypothetical protein A2X94_07235 [Bdellovibrionales bacterium GWB1_55_8]